jgi:uncharacterized protein (TIGR02246 family)
MRLPKILVAWLVIPALALAADPRLADRAEIEEVMAKYVWTVDSLDADGYVSVFTEDATIDSNGNISKGHEQIRKIVTGLIARRDKNKSEGKPPGNLYHVISNVRISFTGKNEALHESYWQTVRRRDGLMSAAAMGRSEDHLVKRNGKWLIKSRKLTVFAD